MENIQQLIDDPEISIYIDNVYTSGFDRQAHKHTKSQLVYAEGGIVHVFTENRHWYIPGRFFMWIPAGMSHRILSHSPHITMYNYFFETDEQDSTFYLQPNIYLVNDLLREMLLFTRGWSGAINEKTTPAKYAFMKAIKAILPEINPDGNTFPINHPYPKDERLLEIAIFLNKDIAASYTIEQVAQHFGYSTRTLSRLFKEQLGFSYVRFFRSIRISKAMELMAENKYAVYEIATMVGYDSLSSFSNLFKRVVGMRPLEYMAQTALYKTTKN